MPINIDDGNACTTDACDPILGVSHTPVQIDDGNKCTFDTCSPQTGVQHVPINPSDNNACTADSCDPALGVINTPINPNDNNACTIDSCDPVLGVQHVAVNINDNNVCTADSCDPILGVQHVAVPVDDNNACTVDACNPQTGVTHTPITCNDGNSCTMDSCNPQLGCVYTSGAYFEDSFANNSKGWTLSGKWAIGSATASILPTYAVTPPFGADPSLDHTNTADNGIAGVAIGGDIGPALLESLTYMTSPVINLSNAQGTVYLEFWRVLNSDYPNYADSTIDVWNGSSWVTIFSVPSNGPHVAETMWTKVSYDVTAYKNAAFQVRFGHSVTGAAAYTVGSWNIDDLRVAPTLCP